MTEAAAQAGDTTTQSRPARASRQPWLWVGLLLFAMVLPWLFFDWQTHRHSGFLLTMLSQMGMMIIFALSYNMLMGQAGLLSFGHAVFFGLGGYCTIHFIDAAGAGKLPVPLELMPVLSALAGLGFGAWKWIWYSIHLRAAPTGTVVLPALMIMLGMQLLLSAAHLDLEAAPREPVNRGPLIGETPAHAPQTARTENESAVRTTSAPDAAERARAAGPLLE